MISLENDKRAGLRLKQERVVGVTSDAGSRIAYMIDVSRGGVKIGTPARSLHPGATVELVMEKGGERFPFKGRVVRDDGAHYIDRIRCTANAVFIKIEDIRYATFVSDHYFI